MQQTLRPPLKQLTLKILYPKIWMEFWDSFEGTIDSHPGLSKSDKFEYLKGCLGGGEARNTVAGFRLTEAN